MKVKAWFEENKTKLRLPERGSNLRSESQELILPFFEKEPDWDKFHHYYFPDGREVYEVNLQNKETPIFGNLLDSIRSIPSEELVIQNIMFIKNPEFERYDPIIARYYPKGELDVKSFKKMNYTKINEYWSGKLELFTYDEHHFIGFEFEEGKIINEITYSKNNTGAKVKDYKNADVRCTTYVLPVTNCVLTSSGTYCSSNYNDLVNVTYCSTGGSGGNYIYTYGGNDGTGSGTYIDPSGVTGTEYIVPIIPAPETFILNQFSNPCGSQIFKQLMKASILKSSIGNLNQANAIIQLLQDANDVEFIVKNSDLTSATGNTTKTKRYINSTSDKLEILIEFDNDYLENATRLSIARTMLHETIHAFLVYNFYKDPTGEFKQGLQNFATTKGYTDMNDVHHNFMPQYVDAIGYSLAVWNQVYGNSGNIPRSYFDDLAWGGLTFSQHNSTTNQYTWHDVFQDLVPSETERIRIQNVINNEANNEYSAKGEPCN
ncbi:hypothetical protein [Algoriphagus pacificus]|uniref:SprT-like family protein n=1 Tax=Algoriphagus pacificus TaxID=2811234 RepID=A0ABS3CCD4_9BACT|nr:hypothetical protein [Algoriphagus pacificus]MBN7814761.1 hypothetical protein [Algoriphagus pacificus]